MGIRMAAHIALGTIVVILWVLTPAAHADSSGQIPQESGGSYVQLGLSYSSPAGPQPQHSHPRTIDTGTGLGVRFGRDSRRIGVLVTLDAVKYDVVEQAPGEYSLLHSMVSLKYAPMYELKREWLSIYMLVGAGVRIEMSRDWEAGPPEKLGLLADAGLGLERDFGEHFGFFAEFRLVWDMGLGRTFLHLAAGPTVRF